MPTNKVNWADISSDSDYESDNEDVSPNTPPIAEVKADPPSSHKAGRKGWQPTQPTQAPPEPPTKSAAAPPEPPTKSAASNWRDNMQAKGQPASHPRNTQNFGYRHNGRKNMGKKTWGE